MRTIHVVTATLTPEARAKIAQSNPALINADATRYFRTKRSADKNEAELLASGIWTVKRECKRQPESVDEAFFALLGAA